LDQTKECTGCKELKPYPGDYITSYARQVIGNECKSCRHARGKINSKKLLGNTDSKFHWNTQIIRHARVKKKEDH